MSPSSEPTPPYTPCPPPSAYHSVWRGVPCRHDAVYSAADLRRAVAPEVGGGCTSAEWTTRTVACCASSLGSSTATMRSNGAAKVAVPSSTNTCPPSHPREEKPNANSVEFLIRPRIRRPAGATALRVRLPIPQAAYGAAVCSANVPGSPHSRGVGDPSGRARAPARCSLRMRASLSSGRWQGPAGRRAGFSKGPS